MQTESEADIPSAAEINMTYLLASDKADKFFQNIYAYYQSNIFYFQ